MKRERIIEFIDYLKSLNKDDISFDMKTFSNEDDQSVDLLTLLHNHFGIVDEEDEASKRVFRWLYNELFEDDEVELDRIKINKIFYIAGREWGYHKQTNTLDHAIYRLEQVLNEEVNFNLDILHHYTKEILKLKSKK